MENGKDKKKFKGNSKSGDGYKKGQYSKGKSSWGKGVKRPAEPMTRADQKQAKKERKMRKPNYDLVEKGNEVWSVLNKTMPKTEKQESLEKIFVGLKGKLALVMNKHDTARVLQQLMKHGTESIRESIVTELTGSIRKMMQDKHGHHFAISMIRYGNDKMKNIVYKEMKGFVAKLGVHAQAAKVVDFYYTTATKRQQLILLNEFFGREFIMTRFDDDEVHDLEQSLATHKDRAKHIKEDIVMILNKATAKQLLMFRHFHGLAYQLFKAGEETDQLELVDLLSKHALPLHHTQQGAYIVCQCLAYGSAKQRKLLLKAIKERVADLATNEHAYMILIRALDVVDDTVLLNSTILSVLKSSLDDLVQDPNGMKVLLSLLVPKSPSYFRKDEIDMLQDVYITKQTDDGEIKEPTSKKSHHTKHADLLSKMLPTLLSYVVANVETLMKDKSTFPILLETVKAAYRVSHSTYPQTEEEKDNVQENTINTLKGNKVAVDEALSVIATTVQNDVSIISTFSGHILLKRLLIHSTPSGEEFGRLLFSSIQEHVSEIVKENRGAFVLNAMLDSCDDETKQSLLDLLQAEASTLSTLDKPGHVAIQKHLKPTGKAAKTPKSSKKKKQTEQEKPTVPKKQVEQDDEEMPTVPSKQTEQDDEEMPTVPKKQAAKTPKSSKKKKQTEQEDEEETSTVTKKQTEQEDDEEKPTKPSPRMTRARKKKLAK